MPRHIIMKRPAKARKRGNRARVNKCRMAGRRAFVDFHVTLPLGSIMSTTGLKGGQSQKRVPPKEAH